uniref:Probable protein-export membrane protein SecG n=1 Tax=Actinocyclus subtilis TaxID=1630683 RepID=A0A2U9NQ15_9STRA|nr:preprotein translocase SecG subunit [Actinocyclus subtilis]AWT39213.1 preprotein translocase SecG subunit [Actinocyclus subtilis]
MIKIIWLLISILLLALILIRIPNNAGLTSFTTKSNFLGSANSAEKFLDNLTWFLIVCYFLLAIKFNYSI